MKWLNKIGTSIYYVLRIDLSDPDLMPASGIVFRKLKNRIDMDRMIDESPLREILEKIPVHSEVVIVFSGDQIISRFFSGEPKNLFEEIEEDDFYFQKLASESGWSIQSACRKSIVDPVRDYIAINKRFVTDMVFDPAVVPLIAEFAGDTHISSGHLKFRFKSGELLAVSEEETGSIENTEDAGTDLDGMSLPSKGISMLAGLLHHLKQFPVLDDSLLDHQNRSKYSKLFRSTLKGLLYGLFALLLINFLLFSSVQQKLEQLKSSDENQSEIIRQIEGMKTQIAEYQHLSLNRKNNPGRTYSFYLEELALIRPSGLWFNELVVDPIRGAQEKGKAIETINSRIYLSGETRNQVSLNTFIKSLGDLPWVREIELMNYEMSQESNYASFELSIHKEE